ncbi:metallophosphoesterase [Neoroseomonas lacus]|uniref:Metallophosphoesterase n=1 Tax=Neoroseomonas lacus TaxID=287609 RepID=A0A917NYB7_9PROT|nr:metallophosphoesterase [Neoroseomonas lacus]
MPLDEVRGATRASFDNLIQTAIDERVAFVIIAGDLFDGDWRDMSTGLYFARAMGRLERTGILVFILTGNHDAASVVTKSVPWPKNVSEFGSRKAQTHLIERLGVAVHGQSFANPSVSENMVTSYPTAHSGYFNIGVLHTSLSGREGHARYAPCDVADLRAKQYDYWALGHVHGFEIVSREPYVVFPGNIQGRSVRETGPKGVVIVEVVDREVVAVDPVEVDVIRWATVDVDCAGADRDGVVSRMRDRLVEAHASTSGGRPLIVRLVLTGATEYAARIREDALSLRDDARAVAEAIGSGIWIEKVQVGLTGAATQSGGHLPDDLTSLIEEAIHCEALATELREDLEAFLSSAKGSLGGDGDEDEMRHAAGRGEWDRLIATAAATLRSRLAGEA